MRASELVKKLKAGDPPTMIDVRSGFEYRSGHIPGAVHCSLMKIMFRLAKLPEDKNQLLVLICEHGPRAQQAQSVLAKAGYDKLELLDGHMTGWRQAHLPIEK